MAKGVKNSILLIGDQPGWAFHNIIKFILENFNSEYDLYYDFLVYHPKQADPNAEANESSTTNFVYDRPLKYSRIPLLRGIEYRRTRNLNQANKLDYNEHGKFQRIREDNTYDVVIYLDYYFYHDGDFDHVKSQKIVMGSYSDTFPPRKKVIHPITNEQLEITDPQEFCDLFFAKADAFVVGSPQIVKYYKQYISIPLHFANMAYDENKFIQRDRKKDTFIIGWTGNPDRQFKGFHEFVVPAIQELKNRGHNIELKTQFQGDLLSLVDFWNAADLAIIASDADAGPSLFMEASLCGIPTVSTKIGMPEYVIQDGVNGLFCERSVKDIVAKIEHLLLNPDIYASFKSRIRKDYIKLLGRDVQVQNWSNLFNIVLESE